MLGNYLNQTASYAATTGTDSRGQLTYGTATTVNCRKQAKTQTVMSKDGRIVTTQHVYYLQNAATEGDMLDGMVVMAVGEWTDLSGNVIGYKAVL